MILTAYLILTTNIIFSIAEPIDEGADIGTVKEYNGKKIVLNPGTFSYLVHLQFTRFNINKDTKKITPLFSTCGGTLIRRDVVLTAAHCLGIQKSTKPNIKAWLGILDTVLDKGKGHEIPVRGYTVHKCFSPSRPRLNIQSVNDIGLLWLAHQAKLDGKYVKLAALPTQDFNAEGKRGWIVVWGRQSNGRKTSMLQKAVVRGVASSQCQKYYKGIRIPSNVICILSDDKQKTSTGGDSGGPFTVQGTIVGVGSFSARDEDNKNEKTGKFGYDATKPAAYTYVPKFVYWIEESLKDGPEIELKKASSNPTARPPSSTLNPRVQSKKPTSKFKLLRS